MGLPALFLIAFAVVSTHGLRYYGCSYAEDLCESGERCEEDGLFGRCTQVSGGSEGDYGAEEDETEEVKFLEGLQPDELRILRDQLAELVSQGGMRWETPLVQCTVAYFFLSHNHDLDYRPNFCKVREPLNVLAVVQLVEEGLDEAQSEAILENLLSSEAAEGAVEERAVEEPHYDYPDYAASLPQRKRGGEEEAEADAALEELLSEAEREEMLQNILASITADLAVQEEEEKEALAEEVAAEYADDMGEAGMSGDSGGELELSPEEQETLDDLLLQVIQGEKPNLDGLSDDLLTKFILNIQMMRAILDGESEERSGEAEEVVPLVARESQSPSEEPRLILKKDTEEIGNLDMGLPAQHNIVKGAAPPSHNLHRIQGNTVYLRLNKDMEHNEGKVLDLMAYLEEAIARPKNLTFSNFNVDGGEISFQVSHSHSTNEPDPQWLASVFGLEAPAEEVESPRPMLPVSSVAEAVYKRRSDIAEVVGGGAEVRETGLGSGEERLAVERKGADGGLVVLTLGVCGLVVGVLASLLSLYVYRNRSHAKAGIERLAHDLEGQPNKAYEELCRARMASAKAEGGGGGSVGGSLSSPPANIAKGSSPRNSSTSSWSEEPVPTTNMDISTGHIILSYLEEHLHKKERLAEEWAGLVSLAGAEGLDATIAALPQNKERNLFPAATPYDVVRVKLGTGDNDYINASPIYDSDPGSPVYIASQHPSEATAELFWEMVWEQGVVLILNLAASNETGPDGTTPLHRYWPSSGSQLYGPFELHLVSEHIWCEDYVVRSFYLKNTRTTETRTVTQFHFLSWSKTKAPTNPKPLLEFRRKVKKSYRGRGGAPMVVHCSDGSGRTGTFCLLDTVLTRINKGVKEMNMAGTVEHLRDQRMGMCGDLDSYTFALSAVAAEVAAILQALPNHNNQH